MFDETLISELAPIQKSAFKKLRRFIDEEDPNLRIKDGINLSEKAYQYKVSVTDFNNARARLKHLRNSPPQYNKVTAAIKPDERLFRILQRIIEGLDELNENVRRL